jgi:hypothetical protein
VACFKTSWNQVLEPNAQDYCQKVSQCSITAICTLPPTPLKASANWSILCIILIWLPSPVWSTHRLFERQPFCQQPRSERSCACMAHHSKTFFLRAHRSLCTAGLHVLKTTITISKMMLLHMLIVIVLFDKN